jgi:hypothetical protein
VSEAEEVGVGIEALVETFRRMGLMWRLLPATVFADDTNTPTSLRITIDGDTDPTRAISLVGLPPQGSRVFVMVVPPQGNYVVGRSGRASTLNENGVGAAAAADATSSAAYANLSGTSSFAFVKQDAASRLKVTIHAGAFVSAAGTKPMYGVQIGGTDYDVVSQTINVTNTHVNISGFSYLTGVPAGSYTVQGRWRRAAGTGSITRNNEDWLSISVKELT